ncbi:MAG: Crp/Fnr family transcriptional regulator [Segetibacter sp.]|nr:Crp/Fnr family transcriptional regulator [Segetibacter sp.]
MKKKKNCDLQSCTLCKGCLKEWLPALDVNRKTYEFKKGELIFKEDEVVTGIYFLNSGKAKVHKKWGTDKELIVRFAGAGDIVGHRGLGNEMIYPVSATAIEEVSVCFIDLDFFLSTLKVNHEYAFNLLMFYAEELQESEKRMRNLAHMTVRGRIAYGLLRLKERFGVSELGSINIILSRNDLASYVGTTYETTFRVLSDFTQEKIVSFSGKNISIINEEKLLLNLQ